MLPLKKIIWRIRTRLHDKDNITYTNDEILDCINCGVRFIRRAIANIRPSLLTSTHEGILKAGTKEVVLDVRPTKIIHVTIGDRITNSDELFYSEKVYKNSKKVFRNYSPIFTEETINTYSEMGLHQTELANIIVHRNDVTGTPREFCLIGEKTLRFFPTPTVDTKYTILAIDDIEELKAEDKSPFNTEFDDFLVEYATTRLAVGNEFDMSQEQAMMSNIYAQIQQILMPPPVGCVTHSYWKH